jgi:hypothetical protein
VQEALSASACLSAAWDFDGITTHRLSVRISGYVPFVVFLLMTASYLVRCCSGQAPAARAKID